MPLAWPSNPSPGDTYVAPNGSPYVYTADGSWKANSIPPAPVTPEAKSWTTVGRPTSPAVGRAGYNTTLNVYEVWVGDAWVSVAGASVVTAATPPISPKVGDMWFDTDSETIFMRVNSVSNGSPIWLDIIGGAGAQLAATQAEVDAGLVSDKFISPLTLNYALRTGTRFGVINQASGYIPGGNYATGIHGHIYATPTVINNPSPTKPAMLMILSAACRVWNHSSNTAAIGATSHVSFDNVNWPSTAFMGSANPNTDVNGGQQFTTPLTATIPAGGTLTVRHRVTWAINSGGIINDGMTLLHNNATYLMIQ